MKSITRRKFIQKGTGVAGCLMFMGSGLFANSNFVFVDDGQVPDPKELNYCGYKCPENCKMFLAGESSDEKLKKEAFKEWEVEKKYGVSYSPEVVFCEKCKGTNDPKSIILKNCTVRGCVIEKGLESCVECKGLAACDKELWGQFPKFKEQVLKMQEVYFESKI